MNQPFFTCLILMIFYLGSTNGMLDNEEIWYNSIGRQASKYEKYTINIDSSQIIWKARRIAYGHKGTIKLKNGEFMVFEGKVKGGKFEVDMNSLANLDLDDGRRKKQLENHLKSSDFFNVKEFPVCTFKITTIIERKTDQGNYAISGDLTIKGTTHKINFPANIEVNDDMLTSSAKITFDRSKFGVRFGSGSFFDNLGDKVIYDDITLEVKLNAYR